MGAFGSAHKDKRDGINNNNINQPHVQAELDIHTRFRLISSAPLVVYIVDVNQNGAPVSLPCLIFEPTFQGSTEQYLLHTETRDEAVWTRFQFQKIEIPPHHQGGPGSHRTIVHPYVKLHKIDPGASSVDIYNIDWSTFKRLFGPYSQQEISDRQTLFAQGGVDPSNPGNYPILWARQNDILEQAYNHSLGIAARGRASSNTTTLYQNNNAMGGNPLLPAVMALLAASGRQPYQQ
jgi:hypothetical protein